MGHVADLIKSPDAAGNYAIPCLTDVSGIYMLSGVYALACNAFVTYLRYRIIYERNLTGLTEIN